MSDTLWPMAYTVCGIFQARILEWVAFPFSRGSSQPRVSRIAGRLFTQEKPKYTGVGSLSLFQGIFPTQELNQGLLHCRRILYKLSYRGSPYAILADFFYLFGPWTSPSVKWSNTYNLFSELLPEPWRLPGWWENGMFCKEDHVIELNDWMNIMSSLRGFCVALFWISPRWNASREAKGKE